MNLAGLLTSRTSSPAALRTMDIVISAALLVVLAPILIVLALTIFVVDGSFPFYEHRRYGKDGRTFLCYKFRSMAADSDARLARHLSYSAEARSEWNQDQKLRNDPRITPIGRLIRKSSLDELPQLLNVLRGEMSLVGPRPIVAAEVARYGRYFVEYCSVLPGMTGIWQISGRNNTGYRRRVAMDSLLARRMSSRLYFGVLFGTARSLMFRQGAY